MKRKKTFAGWLFAAACLLMLLLTAYGCLAIYCGGMGFTPESIALRFSALSPGLVLCAVAALAAFPAAIREKYSVKDADRNLYRKGKAEKDPMPVSAVLLGIAVVFILLGVINGGARDVLIKAINICTECIGLG